MSTTKRTHRVGIALAVACVMGVALAVVGTSSALAQKGEQTKKPAEKVRALVLGQASSPLLAELKRKEGWQLTQSANAKGRGNDPSKYDVLVVDGDAYSPQQLGEGTLVDEFADADRWVLALDVDPADYDQGLKDHTGFTVEERSSKSAMFLFSLQMLNNSPHVLMFESMRLEPLGSENLAPEDQSQLAARLTQQIASSATEAVSADASTLAKEYGSGVQDSPPTQLQHALWAYTPVHESQVLPNCFYDKGGASPLDPNIRVPEPNIPQTASWTITHTFEAYLDNEVARPQGNFQWLTSEVNGEVNPTLTNNAFCQMFQTFHIGIDPRERNLERAWWTGKVGVEVKPDAATDNKLIHHAATPATPNTETNVSSSQEFDVGFSGSQSGPAVSANYKVGKGTSYSIPDWGVENITAGNTPNWLFSARHNCDVRDGHYATSNCFDNVGVNPGDGTPFLPNALSRTNFQFNTVGSWRTEKVLSDGGEGKAQFTVDTPITMVDTYCTNWSLFACRNFTLAFPEDATHDIHDFGPKPRTYSFDISDVNPIPMASLTLAPNPANGTKLDKVTGTVTLERPTPTKRNVDIFSNSENATVGEPISDQVSHGVVTIPQGKTSANFEVLTNDNKLQPGDHTTATITAFYTTPKQEQLRVVAQKKK